MRAWKSVISEIVDRQDAGNKSPLQEHRLLRMRYQGVSYGDKTISKKKVKTEQRGYEEKAEETHLCLQYRISAMSFIPVFAGNDDIL